MPRAVPVIDVFGPDRRPCNRVEQRRQDALGKLRPGQSDHTLQYTGTVALLLGGRRADWDHAGYVGRATQVLTARVNQQQAVSFNQRMLLLGCMVMGHCTIGIESSDGVETQRYKPGTTGTSSGQAFINSQFGNSLTPERRFQPRKKLTQCRTILLHGLTNMNGVIKALLRFGQGGRIQAFDQFHFSRQMAEEPAGHPGGIHQQPGRGRQGRQRRIDPGVFAQLYAITGQGFTQFATDLAQVDKQGSPGFLD